MWADRDASFAWGGREELGALFGRPEVCEPYSPPRTRLADLRFLRRDEWFAGWDPERFALSVRADTDSVQWYTHGTQQVALTVVTADRDLLDYRIVANVNHNDVDEALGWLAHGPAVLEALAAEDPYPPAREWGTEAGAVIDLERRAIGFWSANFAPPRLIDAVRDAWPGWRVVRLAYGYAGHLAATGRAPAGWLDTPLRYPDGPDPVGDALPAWDADRRALPVDPRPLRAPEICVVTDGVDASR